MRNIIPQVATASDFAEVLDPWHRDAAGNIDVENVDNCRAVLRMSGIHTIRVGADMKTAVNTMLKEFRFKSRKAAAIGMCEFAQKQFGFYPRIRVMGRVPSEFADATI